MKKYIPYIAIVVFAYLIGAFVAGDWNSAHWQASGKALLSIFTVFALILYSIRF